MHMHTLASACAYIHVHNNIGLLSAWLPSDIKLHSVNLELNVNMVNLLAKTCDNCNACIQSIFVMPPIPAPESQSLNQL